MKRLFAITVLILTACSSQPVTTYNMKITSSAFQANGNIPSLYTCDGANINPPLEFTDIPEGTQSLALIVDDPDAPVGDWVHWLVWNIDPATQSIPENSVPSEAVLGTTDFKSAKWGGPCPPSGTHRYYFKLYALSTDLDLATVATKADLLSAMEANIIEEAELIGLYQRQ